MVLVVFLHTYVCVVQGCSQGSALNENVNTFAQKAGFNKTVTCHAALPGKLWRKL